VGEASHDFADIRASWRRGSSLETVKALLTPLLKRPTSAPPGTAEAGNDFIIASEGLWDSG